MIKNKQAKPPNVLKVKPLTLRLHLALGPVSSFCSDFFCIEISITLTPKAETQAILPFSLMSSVTIPNPPPPLPPPPSMVEVKEDGEVTDRSFSSAKSSHPFKVSSGIRRPRQRARAPLSVPHTLPSFLCILAVSYIIHATPFSSWPIVLNKTKPTNQLILE